MVSLTSDDLVSDRDAVARSSYIPERVLNARRPVAMPDGRTEETDSSCFYVWNRKRPYLTLFLSQHLKPEIIWVPEYQSHPNTAVSVSRLTYVSPDPREECDYFEALLGVKALASSSADECICQTARGERIELLTPARLEERYRMVGFRWSPEVAAYGVALKFVVRSLDTCRSTLGAAGVEFAETDTGVVVAAREAVGVIVEFAQEQMK